MVSLNFKEYDKIIKECSAISRLKNRDYGSDSLIRFGVKGIIVRMSDKMDRIVNLTMNDNKAMVVDEKSEDTLKDMINYSVYAIMILRKRLVNNEQSCNIRHRD